VGQEKSGIDHVEAVVFVGQVLRVSVLVREVDRAAGTAPIPSDRQEVPIGVETNDALGLGKLLPKMLGGPPNAAARVEDVNASSRSSCRRRFDSSAA
jgi:hypothetical protein